MAKTMLLVGTRKGLFVFESDDRRDWSIRGPYCDGWPIYDAIHDPQTGDIYAAAASEWHGAGVWRSSDLGETWQLSSEGLGYSDGGELKLSKISGITAAHGRLLAGAESVGVFESGDRGASWSLLSTLDGQPGRTIWNDHANQPPGHLGMPAILPDPDDADRFWVIVQGQGIFETTDDGGSWTPRNQGLRAEWPREYDDVGFCVHKLVMAPLTTRACSSRTTVACIAPTTAATVWSRDHRGPAQRLRLRRRRAPARPRHLLRDPARPRPRPHHARRPCRRLAHPRRRLSWQRLDDGLPSNAHWACCARAWRSMQTTPGLYFGTSTGQVFASTDEGDQLD